MSKLEHSWRKNNNYIEKLVTERLSQIIYDFVKILRDHERLLDIILDFQI
jgi:hypothetical protein